MSAPDHFDFYTFVLFLHIAAAVIAFGATFAFPIIDVTIRRVDLRALPVWSEAQNQIGMKLITPGAIVVLISGIYMASDRWDKFGGLWFSLAGVIVIVLLGLGHGFFAPTARTRRPPPGQSRPRRRRGRERRDERRLRGAAGRMRAVGILSLAAGADRVAADGLEAGGLDPHDFEAGDAGHRLEVVVLRDDRQLVRERGRGNPQIVHVERGVRLRPGGRASAPMRPRPTRRRGARAGRPSPRAWRAVAHASRRRAPQARRHAAPRP